MYFDQKMKYIIEVICTENRHCYSTLDRFCTSTTPFGVWTTGGSVLKTYAEKAAYIQVLCLPSLSVQISVVNDNLQTTLRQG